MDFNVVDEFEGNVNDWASHWRTVLESKGITVIEGFNQTIKGSSISVLPADFLTLCCQSSQKFVFLYRIESHIDNQITASITHELGEHGEDLPTLINVFSNMNAKEVACAKLHCPTHHDAEFLLWHQGGAILTGVRSGSFDNLMQAIEDFCESVEDRRQATVTEQQAKDLMTLERIASELKGDAIFLSIRGKRKRCVYVQSKYGDRIGEGKFLRRPDPSSELMNADIVALVEKVSDEVDLQQKAGQVSQE